jgi:hypothetical protein
MANDLVQCYIEDQLHSVNKQLLMKEPFVDQLNWTGSKVALIELIYALYHQSVFDNGNADIKTIAQAFEITFNIDLGDFYHTFMELKSRKVNQTKFLDNLRETLIRKMDEQEEK